jgi:DNA-binding response OmpR family regulator
MTVFGWIADGFYPPSCWDLRLRGWTLCPCGAGDEPACDHPLLVDARMLGREEQFALVRSSSEARRLILLGVEDGNQRAALLARGCAEALPAQTGLPELETRAWRAAELAGMLPRSRRIDPLTLDLFHRDARSDRRWLGLHPREFELLWRLAEEPGRRLTRRELLRDVWRIHHEPETNSVEVHVSRLRGKLAGVGCEAMIQTANEGGYRLVARPSFSRVPGLFCGPLPGSAFAPLDQFADS